MKTFDRNEVYNNLIQIYNDESHDEIIERLDLIEDIKEKRNSSLSFLINQDIMELEDIKETLK
jgi:tRNA-dihydrouridine synthase